MRNLLSRSSDARFRPKCVNHFDHFFYRSFGVHLNYIIVPALLLDNQADDKLFFECVTVFVGDEKTTWKLERCPVGNENCNKILSLWFRS